MPQPKDSKDKVYVIEDISQHQLIKARRESRQQRLKELNRRVCSSKLQISLFIEYLNSTQFKIH